MPGHLTTLADDSKVQTLTLPSPEQKIFNGLPFPLILTPKESNFKSADDTVSWLKKNKDQIKCLLLEHGAILFRGFPVHSAEKFDSFVKSFDYEAFPYVGGAAPRRVIIGNVFTANEAPPDQLIPFHHEMAQVPTFPSTLFFYCDVPPPEGGQTPLVLSNEVYKAMLQKNKGFVEELEEKGVVYNRVMPDEDDPASPIGRGWRSTYQTSDRKEVETKCAEQGTSFEWLPDNCLRTRTATLPAIRTESRTGKKTWFNSIIAAYLGWGDVRNDRKKAVTYPDGKLMHEGAMETLENVFESLAIYFTWKKDDIVMIDNKLVLHSRRTFTRPRQILACLCK